MHAHPDFATSRPLRLAHFHNLQMLEPGLRAYFDGFH